MREGLGRHAALSQYGMQLLPHGSIVCVLLSEHAVEVLG